MQQENVKKNTVLKIQFCRKSASVGAAAGPAGGAGAASAPNTRPACSAPPAALTEALEVELERTSFGSELQYS